MPYVTVMYVNFNHEAGHITYVEGLSDNKMKEVASNSNIKEYAGSNSKCRKLDGRAPDVLNILEHMDYKLVSTTGSLQQGICWTLRK